MHFLLYLKLLFNTTGNAGGLFVVQKSQQGAGRKPYTLLFSSLKYAKEANMDKTETICDIMYKIATLCLAVCANFVSLNVIENSDIVLGIVSLLTFGGLACITIPSITKIRKH